MSNVEVLVVPYDSGRRGLRMGAGPEHFVRNGLGGALQVNGCEVRIGVVEAQGSFLTENTTAFELLGLLAGKVREAKLLGRFPLVLSGNCNATVGTISGVRDAEPGEEMGLVWFDGHADFKTPETSTSGFLDGMGLSIAVGHCWEKAVRTIPGFRPIREENVVLVGTRGAEAADRERLAHYSGLTVVTEAEVGGAGAGVALVEALDRLRAGVDSVHVHLDLDVLDPQALGMANEYAPEAGLTVEEVEGAIQRIRERFRLTSANIASFDPAQDRGGNVLRAGIAFAKVLTR